MDNLLLLAKESSLTWKQASDSKVLLNAFAKAGISIPTDLSLNISDEHVSNIVIPTLELVDSAAKSMIGALLKQNYSSLPDAESRIALLMELTVKSKAEALVKGVVNHDTVICIKIDGTSVNGYVKNSEGGGKGSPHVLIKDICDIEGNSIPSLDFMCTDQGHPISDNFYQRFLRAEHVGYQRVSINIQGSDGVKVYNLDSFLRSLSKNGKIPLSAANTIEVTKHFNKFAVDISGQRVLVVNRPVSKNPDINFLPFELSTAEVVVDMQELFVERKATSKVLRKSIAEEKNNASLFGMQKVAAENDAKLKSAGKIAGFAAVREANPELTFAEQLQLFQLIG
jgi:hypothetical protein